MFSAFFFNVVLNLLGGRADEDLKYVGALLAFNFHVTGSDFGDLVSAFRTGYPTTPSMVLCIHRDPSRHRSKLHANNSLHYPHNRERLGNRFDLGVLGFQRVGLACSAELLTV